MSYKFITHGSENSLDKDVYVIIPEPIELREAKKLCDSFKDINANLIHIKNGKIDWVYKGTEDECNNSILATYHLHKQDFDCPVLEKADRSYASKMLRTIRGLLSYASRTEYREIVKKSLVSNSMEEKIETLKTIDLTKITDFQKSSIVETYKFYAFQMGQTLALLENNVELFTKNSVSQYYPELADYLARKESTPQGLQSFYERFTNFISKQYKPVEHLVSQQLFVSEFHGKKEVYNVKKEKVLPPVVIFDIDGTLMNEEHRAQYRDAKDWKTYFSLCGLDSPIQSIIDLTHEYKSKGYEVWAMSGRAATCENDTLESFKKHNVYFDHMKLRGEGNMIPDYVIKPAWVKKLIGLERVNAIYDDSPRVIESFRKLGLNVIDVTDINLNNGQQHYKKMSR